MKNVFLFPGQGSQYVGMGKDFYDNYAEAKKIYDLLEKMLTADELANLQIKISGFVEEEIVEDSLENQIEEVKNV